MKIRCPICKRTTTWEENTYRPFCSERCKMIDLGYWAMEKYRIPGEPVEDGHTEKDSRGENQGSN